MLDAPPVVPVPSRFPPSALSGWMHKEATFSWECLLFVIHEREMLAFEKESSDQPVLRCATDTMAIQLLENKKTHTAAFRVDTEDGQTMQLDPGSAESAEVWIVAFGNAGAVSVPPHPVRYVTYTQSVSYREGFPIAGGAGAIHLKARGRCVRVSDDHAAEAREAQGLGEHTDDSEVSRHLRLW
jgi:hypothetical protein